MNDNNKYIIAIDSGSNSTKLALINIKGEIVKFFSKNLQLISANSNYLEHNPKDIIDQIFELLHSAIAEVGISNILGIGISNQRESVVVWDKNTSLPIYPVISWQDSRTKNECENLSQHSEIIQKKTGLQINSYFSATKIKWILQNVPHQIENLFAGTIDSWIVWNLTKGASFLTDVTNASRTLLFNIQTLEWDNELLNIFGIPKSILANVKNNIGDFGSWEFEGVKIPILALIGDQQSSLFASGMKTNGICTYGTGAFFLSSTNQKIIYDKHLFSTVALKINEDTYYALEASILCCGNILSWLQKKNLIDSFTLEKDYKFQENNFFLPFTSLNPLFSKKELLASTYLFLSFYISTYFQYFKSAFNSLNIPFSEFSIAGKISQNDFFMQMQSNLSEVKLSRLNNFELSLLGAGFLVGLKLKLWDLKEISNLNKKKEIFSPQLNASEKKQITNEWKKNIKSKEHLFNLLNKFSIS